MNKVQNTDIVLLVLGSLVRGPKRVKEIAASVIPHMTGFNNVPKVGAQKSEAYTKIQTVLDRTLGRSESPSSGEFLEFSPFLGRTDEFEYFLTEKGRNYVESTLYRSGLLRLTSRD